MKIRTALSTVLVALVVAALTLGTAGPAAADHSRISGYVTDANTGQPLGDVCVTLGPPITCFTRTDGSGFFIADLALLAAPDGGSWDMYFLKSGYRTAYSQPFTVSGPVTFNQALQLESQPDTCATTRTDAATSTVYLPNITKTLGGATGWQTPFIVQNTGTAGTTLEVSFYRFLNGACVTRRSVAGLAPGTSFADVPNNDTDLPGDTQFAVVVRSFGARIVAVVNQHQGVGDRAEALAYTGTASGATTVYLPNIVRRFFGYVTPFIIQNLGGGTTTATARFVSFDGSAPTVTVTRTIASGRSKFVDPNSDDPTLGASGLVDGKQYAVTVTASQPLTVVVNTHLDAAWVAQPVAYSTNGLTTGAASVYGAYAAKNASGIGRVSTIVVQNLGTSAITPSLSFTPLQGSSGSPQTFSATTPVAPGGSWAFDPRFTVGTTTPCNSASATCLGDGEYTFVASAAGNIAAVVNVISPATAMGYAATPAPTVRSYLPNVTRTLGGPGGWTTPILLQAVSASGATVSWYRFSDGALVHTQTLAIPAGSGVHIDPREVGPLADNTQYAVVIDGTGGTVAAIVVEVASGGDNAMIYEGFGSP